MEEKSKIESLLKHAGEYAETRFGQVALNVQEKLAIVLSSGISSIFMIILVLFVLLFMSIGGAWLLGEYFKSPSIGFFMIGGFYLLLACIYFLNREKWIKTPVTNALIKKMNFNGEN
jgi:hypothetical protein